MCKKGGAPASAPNTWRVTESPGHVECLLCPGSAPPRPRGWASLTGSAALLGASFLCGGSVPLDLLQRGFDKPSIFSLPASLLPLCSREAPGCPACAYLSLQSSLFPLESGPLPAEAHSGEPPPPASWGRPRVGWGGMEELQEETRVDGPACPGQSVSKNRELRPRHGFQAQHCCLPVVKWGLWPLIPWGPWRIK